MKKQSIVLGFLLVVVLFLAACTSNNEPESGIDWLPTAGITYIGSQELEDILNDESETGFFVYIGTPGCPFCREFEPILLETMEYLDLGIRYFHIDYALEADEDFAFEIFGRVDEVARPVGWGGGVPVIMYFVGGDVLDLLSGVQSQEAVIEFFERQEGSE